MKRFDVPLEASMKSHHCGVLLRPGAHLYWKGSAVLYNGDITPYLYEVVCGAMSLSKTTLDNRTITYAVVTRGQLIGEESLTNACRCYDATAIIETVVKKVVVTPNVLEALNKDIDERHCFLEKLYAAKTCLDRIRLIQSRFDTARVSVITMGGLVSMSREAVIRTRTYMEERKSRVKLD